MPYFRWKGVTVLAETERGTTYAKSVDTLDQQLFERGVALLGAKATTWRWRGGPIWLRHLVQTFRQLTVLVGTGVLLPEALEVVAGQTEHARLQDVMHEIADEVSAGKPLSRAMATHPDLFSGIIVQLVEAGEESGMLPQALDAACTHLERTEDFYMRARSAVLLPVVTLGFFCFIATAIFVAIIPYFASLFSSMNQELPFATRLMLSISNFIRSRGMLIACSCIGMLVVGLGIAGRRPETKKRVDTLLAHAPIIGVMLSDRFLAHFLHALSLLLEGGIPLVHALGIVSVSVNNHYFAGQVEALERAVSSGSQMSAAMRHLALGVRGDELIAMVRVGEESGRLAFVFKRSAGVYHERLMRKLAQLTTLLQPLLMVLLGGMITVLVFAIYGPIVNMASIV